MDCVWKKKKKSFIAMLLWQNFAGNLGKELSPVHKLLTVHNGVPL